MMNGKEIKKRKTYRSPDEIIVKLKKLIKLIDQVQQDNKNYDITPAQARILFPIIKYERGYTIQALANIGGVTKGLVSRTITVLESKGYVERDKKTANQDRNYNIILSEKGKVLAAEKKAKMQEIFKNLEGRITHKDMESFVRVLDTLTEISIPK